MKADSVTKDFVSDADVFADVFNYYVYGGERVICPQELTERDPTELALPYGADGAVVAVQRFRDVMKLYGAMTDGKAGYVLCGVENQTSIHYAMAVRNNLYDALDYAGQVEEAAKSHRKAMRRKRGQRQKKSRRAGGNSRPAGKDEKSPNKGEFLGGFWKEDKLIPTITVTIYFGSDEWDGPLSLFDMMEVTDPKVLSLMDNYHVNLIAPAQMTDEEIKKFRTDLREVLLFIKYSRDNEKLKQVLKANEGRFRGVDPRAVDVIEAVTNMGIRYEKKEGKVDVCKAIEDMKLEARREGIKEGERIGERRGEKRGERRGRRQGEKKGILKQARKSARNFYKMGLGVEQIAAGVGYNEEMVRQWLEL